MKRVMNIYYWLFLCLLFFNPNLVLAEEISSPQKELVQEWIAASNAHDVERFKKLIHLECLKRINTKNKAYYDDVIFQSLKYRISDDYTVRISEIPFQEQGVGMEGLLTYPVKPTHRVQIDFNLKKYSGVTIMREIVESGDQWFFVFADPTDQALVKFQEKKEFERKESEQATQIAKDLDPHLIKELEDLIKEGKKMDAFKRLGEVKNITLILAMRVLKELGLDE